MKGRGHDAAFEAWLARFGVVLREVRKSRDMRLKDLARASGVSISMLGELEKGDVAPSLATLTAVARVLRVRISELLPNVP